MPVTIEFTPPTLEVLGATHYLHQGGGGLVALRAKGASRVGVKVGDRASSPPTRRARPTAGSHVALFALPWNLPDATPITAWAEDEAGNAVSRPLPSELKPRRFPSGTVEISDKFLAAKLPELLPERASIPPEQLVPAFLVVNRDKRKAAEDTKRQVATRTRPRPLWEGAFIQPRNTKVFSNFAETRSYRYGGKEIDTQVHLGFDLASLKNSPVPAANSGVVVFAGPLTIYGNAVIVDHGLGLQTLYGHLSSLAVKEGDEVKQGQELGRTGTTGLAVGDHLHFEVLIQGDLGDAGRMVGRQVDPRPHRPAAHGSERPAARVRVPRGQGRARRSGAARRTRQEARDRSGSVIRQDAAATLPMSRPRTC